MNAESQNNKDNHVSNHTVQSRNVLQYANAKDELAVVEESSNRKCADYTRFKLIQYVGRLPCM